MIILEESVCVDCKWKGTCAKFERIDGIDDSRVFKEGSYHKNEVFEVIIKRCSIKNIDRRYRV